jgi:hypothetical protein
MSLTCSKHFNAAALTSIVLSTVAWVLVQYHVIADMPFVTTNSLNINECVTQRINTHMRVSTAGYERALLLVVLD